MKPYYADGWVTIYHGDAREWLPAASVMVTDPPYGIDYRSGKDGKLARSIHGDNDASVRDAVLRAWFGPSLVFGSWRIARPLGTRQVLIWDSMGALGMGALDLPWKPSHHEIYVIGRGFTGHRGNDVLTYPPVQGTARNGRLHPNQKPVPLMRDLISKCPPGNIVDPFMGVGSTLVAAKSLNRSAVGIELLEEYCEKAAIRCQQETLGLGAA